MCVFRFKTASLILLELLRFEMNSFKNDLFILCYFFNGERRLGTIELNENILDFCKFFYVFGFRRQSYLKNWVI